MTEPEQCNEAVVRAILDASVSRELLAERRARDGNRRVSLLDSRHVLKEFDYPAGTRPARRPWRREHAALIHLGDPRLPTSCGYLEERGAEVWTLRYLRSFVPGEAIDGFDAATAAEAGELLAALHARRLVTDDALTQNFMRAPDGRLFFLDFGKSRIFAPGSVLLPVWIALEHCRFLRASLAGDESLWVAFRDAYFAAVDGGSLREKIVRALTRLVLWQRRLRRRRREPRERL